MLKYLNKLNTDNFNAIQKSWTKKSIQHEFIQPNRNSFIKAINISIDYMIIENFKKLDIDLKVLPLNAGWTDLGSYESFSDIYNLDKNNNLAVGSFIESSSKNNIVLTNSKTVFFNHINNIALINTDDVLFVSNKNKLNDLKNFINKNYKKNKLLFDNNYE